MLPFCDCFYAEPVNGCVFEVSRLLLPPQSAFRADEWFSWLVGTQPTKVGGKYRLCGKLAFAEAV
jgi:hypothetical protein